jgi:hypothetical protein
MLIAGGLYQCEYWVARAEHIYRDRCDLYRDQAWRMHKQNHDQRFECTIKKLKRNDYGRSCSDAAALSNDADYHSDCERKRYTHNAYAHG